MLFLSVKDCCENNNPEIMAKCTNHQGRNRIFRSHETGRRRLLLLAKSCFIGRTKAVEAVFRKEKKKKI